MIYVLEGIEEVKVCSYLFNEYNLEIGVGFGVLAGKVWCIGVMGYGVCLENIVFCLWVFEELLC